MQVAASLAPGASEEAVVTLVGPASMASPASITCALKYAKGSGLVPEDASATFDIALPSTTMLMPNAMDMSGFGRLARFPVR